MKKYRLNIKTVICFLLITVVFSNMFSLARYHTSVSGTSIANVAKWDNNIVIVGDSSFIFDNNAINNQTLAFNLISDSEVDSRYDISIDYVPYNIKLELSDSTNSGSVIVDGTDITIGFGSTEETFAIPNISTTSTINNVTLTSTVGSTSTILLFEKSNEDMRIKVEIVSGYVNVSFMNFGIISYGANQAVAHTLEFSTAAVPLSGINELQLYATFEQID